MQIRRIFEKEIVPQMTFRFFQHILIADDCVSGFILNRYFDIFGAQRTCVKWVISGFHYGELICRFSFQTLENNDLKLASGFKIQTTENPALGYGCSE